MGAIGKNAPQRISKTFIIETILLTKTIPQSPILTKPMPQINFQICWPDGYEQTCYSPSLIVKEYFAPDVEYKLDEFVESARTALNIASDRVKAKYGRPCGLAIGQLQDIETRASEYQNLEDPKVKFIRFIE